MSKLSSNFDRTLISLSHFFKSCEIYQKSRKFQLSKSQVDKKRLFKEPLEDWAIKSEKVQIIEKYVPKFFPQAYAYQQFQIF